MAKKFSNSMKYAIFGTIVGVILLIIGSILLGVGLYILQRVIPKIEYDNVMKYKVFAKHENGAYNGMTKRWVNHTHKIIVQYWFFNYTNPLEITDNGAWPDFIEKGPYTYVKLQRNKVDQWLKDDSEVSYRTTSTYKFEKSMSCPTCDPHDMFHIPDVIFSKLIVMLIDPSQLLDLMCKIPIIGDVLCSDTGYGITIDKLKIMIDKYANDVSLAMQAFGVNQFVQASVDEILFSGYDDPIFSKMINGILKIAGLFIDPDIAAFLPKNISSPKITVINDNNTVGIEYTISTGLYDRSMIGQVVSFFDSANSTSNSDGSFLPKLWWFNPNRNTCSADLDVLARKINGTGGATFKPYIRECDQLYVYIPDICRSVYLTFKRHVIIKASRGTQQLSAYRYTIPKDVYTYKNKESCGFCHPIIQDLFLEKKGSACLPDGLLDISHCLPGNLPIIISNPHFFGADKVVNSFFPRLYKEPEIDETTVDIEPITGTVIKFNKRYQINVVVSRFEKANALKAIRPGAYPLLWLNESYTSEDDEISDIYDHLIGPRKNAEKLCWLFGVGFGIFFIIIAITFISIAGYLYIKDRRHWLCNSIPAEQRQDGSLGLTTLSTTNEKIISTNETKHSTYTITNAILKLFPKFNSKQRKTQQNYTSEMSK